MIATTLNQPVGIVVVGRNEGERLRRALCSALAQSSAVVYVDSGSDDGSVALAHELNVDVVELDPNKPFTAARAYNSGVAHLGELNPDAGYAQFLDGDCELVTDWLQIAFATMERDPQVAVICGRRREEFRDRNVFHRIIDMEWNTRIGEATECGAEGLMRLGPFRQVGGFDESLIAGEEPELCLRLRRAGGKVLRINADVSIHDVHMSSFYQWWKRTLRSGYGTAECAWRYGRGPERFCVRTSASTWLWALLLPVLAVVLAEPTHGLSLLAVLALYLLQAFRIAHYRNLAHGDTRSDAWLYAAFCLLGKVPQLQGQIEFLIRLSLGQPRSIIEYS